MREIKFRAWDVDGKCWIPYNLCHLDFRGKLYTFDDSQEDYAIYLEETIPYIVCQFTGLKDKNGREIYEGDVVEIKDFCYDPSNSLSPIRTIRSLVEYKDGAFITADVLLSDYLNEREVIGNIYENEDLAKERENALKAKAARSVD